MRNDGARICSYSYITIQALKVKLPAMMNRSKRWIPETSFKVRQYLPESIDLHLQATFFVHGEHELLNLAILGSKMNTQPTVRNFLII